MIPTNHTPAKTTTETEEDAAFQDAMADLFAAENELTAVLGMPLIPHVSPEPRA